jgi:hypothetical protein
LPQLELVPTGLRSDGPGRTSFLALEEREAAMAHRIEVNMIDPGDRQALVDLMLQYLTDAVVAEHMAVVHSGIDFFTGHRSYIGELEAWLATNGPPQFVPLPEWDPQNPIPDEFDVVRPRDDGTPRAGLQNLNPGMPLPPEFGSAQLCNFATGDDLANAINGWHGSVHGAIGGAMGSFMEAPAAPIFWCWHSFLDDVYYDWEACQVIEDGKGEDHPPGHGQPASDEYERYKAICEERRSHYEQKPLEFDDDYLLPLYRSEDTNYGSA